jgi:membrane associated rhomboid family serine protease
MSQSFSSGTWHGSEGPIFTVGSLRVDLTLLLIGIHTLAMAVGAVFAASGLGDWVNQLAFSAGDLKAGQIWTLFTYPFVHDIRQEGLWFGLEMLMFFWFGREVESAIGRRSFGLLYGALAVIPALVLAGTGPLLGTTVLAGSGTISFAIFLAFCALHPGAQFFFAGLTAKWVGWILLAIYSLASFAGRDWPGLLQLWLSSLFAVAWVRRGSMEWPAISLPKGRKKNPKAKSAAAKKSAAVPVLEKVDAILDKISKEGIHSLTAAEKKQLEDARARLLQKDRQDR